MNVRLYRFFFENQSAGLKTTTELIHDVDGWKNYGVTFGRETGISNIVKSYTNSWIFVGEDAEFLKSIFYKYGANSKVRLIIKKLSNYMVNIYETEYSGYFDFTQIVISNTVTIPINEGGFFKLLENKWSKDYEIEMNNAVLGFDGVKIPETAIMEATGSKTFIGSDGSPFKAFIVGLSAKNTIKKYDFFQNTQTNDITATGEHNINMGFLLFKSGFIENFKIGYNVDVTISLKNALPQGVIYTHSYKILCSILEFDYEQIEQGSLSESDALRTFYISNPNDPFIPAIGNTFNLNFQYKFKKYGNLLIEQNGSNGKVYIMSIKLLVNGLTLGSNLETKIDYHSLFLNCSLETMLNKNRDFQCVRINHVFQELIKSINNNKYRVEIDFSELNKYVANDEINRYDVLTNGNGLRGKHIVLTQDLIDLMDMGGIHFENLPEFSWAKLTTSLEQFLKFLYIAYGLKIVLNYDILTDKYKVSMLHEDKSFNNTEIAQIDNIKNYKIVPERELYYTDIKVGYTTKDDSIGGKEEYNATLEFTTMITEIEQNILDLVSPYSASVFDIETFLYNNYQNFKDGADKDNEIFVLSCKKHPTAGLGYFSIRRGVSMTSGIAFPQSAWNLELSPKRILLNHKKLLNSCFAFNLNEKITLSAVKRNRSVNAGGIVESDNIFIDNDKTFYPILIEFEAPATSELIKDIENNRNGYISFMHNNIKYKGYLYSNTSVTINPMNEKSSTFTLICHPESIPKF